MSILRKGATRLESALKSNARVVNRFNGYSVVDCDCKYCLYFAGKGKPCPLKKCCFEEERAEAILRERRQIPISSQL